MESALPVAALLGLLGGGLACGPAPTIEIVAHRAQGVGELGENLPQNAAAVLAAGFGVEIDVRGDGEAPFALGHLAPNGYHLDDALELIRDRWDPSFAGLPVILDVANDLEQRVSGALIDHLHDTVAGTPLDRLRFVAQSSSWESLTRMHTQHQARASAVEIAFAMVYWSSPEYTAPLWVDYVTTNVVEVGEYPHPRPLLLFGVESRSTLRQAEHSLSDVRGVITDHPRRLRELTR